MQKMPIYAALLLFAAFNCQGQRMNGQVEQKPMAFEVQMSETEWLKKLGKEAYHVIRNKGTERPFTGKYWNHKDEGTYRCAGCQLPLFDSKTKFKSGTGWPSFYAPISERAVLLEKDYSYDMQRDELICRRCGGHLGHLFKDGPKPTGLRYCINSLSLHFEHSSLRKK